MAAETVKSIEQVEDKMRAGVADFSASCRDSVSALLASGQAMINGCQTMNSRCMWPNIPLVDSRAA